MTHSSPATLIGSVGVAFLLLAFLLNLLRVRRADGYLYTLLNLLGATLACYSSYLIGFMPFVVLEGSWAVIAGIALGRTMLGACGTQLRIDSRSERPKACEENPVNDLRIVPADLSDPRHHAAVLSMTRAYALDPMGNGRNLPDDVQRRLVDGLRAHPTTLIFLALHREEVVGIATCFVGFSTFAARPLVNIHDLHVANDYRRRGVARSLLEAIETEARSRGCCKLTLEVQENNRAALALYESWGFAGGQYAPQAGAVLFREKKL
jgi:ribosomal protein S18 acetylase RimI-like enzyme